MIGSAKVREARKAQQNARLKEKAKTGAAKTYPTYYANMPQQKVKAAAQAQIREDRKAIIDATETLLIAEIDGEGLLAAQEKLIIARKVLELHERAERPTARMSLTAAGEG